MNEFVAWVKKNFKGEHLDAPPSDWNKEGEFFYNIGGLQYRVPKDELKKFCGEA